ncbi:MAG: DoxX-like family protein [Flavobacteriales bacterium]
MVRFVQHRAFRYLFAIVWLVNGLWCKVLGWVPRHEVIVGAILDSGLAPQLTIAIGIAEIGMAAWIITAWRYQVCAASQIAIILLMNVIEFIAVPHLLLWGRLNIVFATLLCGMIFWNAFSRTREAHA